MVVRLLL